MKNSKSILALVLALMLTMTLFACNKADENKAVEENTEKTEEAKTEENKEEEKEASSAQEAPKDALTLEVKKAESLDAKYDNAYAFMDTENEEEKAKYDELYPNDPYKQEVELEDTDEPNKANYIALQDKLGYMDRMLDEATDEKPYDTARNKGERVLNYILSQEDGKDPVFFTNRYLYDFLGLELETGDKLKIKDWADKIDEPTNVILGFNQKDRYELGKTYEIDYFGSKLSIVPVGVAKEGAKFVNGKGEEINLDNAIITPLNYNASKAMLNEEQCKEINNTSLLISPEADKAMYVGNYLRGAYKVAHLKDLVK